MVVPGTLFEEFGFNYIGPIDGHDLDALVADAAEHAASCKGPQFLHVVTKQGQGLQARRGRPDQATTARVKFDPAEGIDQQGHGAAKPTYTQVFGDWLCDMAARDPRLVGITPAMREGSGMVRVLASAFPERYFDVGIAEQHAVTFAAGLACEGMKPVVAIYSTFLQRAYDQLIHDVALQNLPVVFALDRGGLVGADGATHHGQLRPRLPALRPEHDRDGAGRRERVPADAVHRRSRSTARRRCAIRAAPAPASRSSRS